MKIECPSCAAKYSIGDDKVQDRLAKIRCRKCGTTIVIDGKQNPPHIYAADAGSAAADVPGPTSSPSPSAGGEFTVDFGDGDQRNLTLGIADSRHSAARRKQRRKPTIVCGTWCAAQRAECSQSAR